MIRQVLDETRHRVNMTIARGIVSGTNDDKKMQRHQVRLLSKEVKDDVERFHNYGFTSVPHNGADAAVMFVGGNRDHGLIVAVDDRRYRLKGLKGGEVALYTDEGTSIVLKRGKLVEITCKDFKLTCETLTIDATTSITVTSPSIDVNKS